MKATIGQVIRRLRKERNFTQEELAEQLGVTAQAVSKWESEIGMPDISQVVPLATVFGVPTDVLFGRYGVNDSEEVGRICEEIEQMNNRTFASNEEALAVEMQMIGRYREVLKTYPNNTRLLLDLCAQSYLTVQEYSEIMEAKQQEELLNESIRNGNLVVKYSSETAEVINARRWIAAVYAKMNRWNEAYETVGQLPLLFDDIRGIRLAELKWEAGETKEERELRCDNLHELLKTLHHQVVMLGHNYAKEEQYEDAYRCYSFLRGLIVLLYGEDEYVPPFHVSSIFLYIDPAFCLVKLGRYEEAVDLLEQGMTFEEKQAEHYNVREKPETPLLRENTFHYVGNEYGPSRVKARIRRYKKDFAPLEENPRYRAILEKLGEA